MSKADKISEAELIARWVRPQIRALNAYHVPPAKGFIKLDAMENPYTWPESTVDAWLDVLRGADLNRYPDASAHALTTRMRKAMDVPDGVELLLGNGSDELIQMILLAVAGPGRKALFPTPTFSMYHIIAQYAGVECVGVPLRADDFGLDVAAFLRAIDEHAPAVIFLAYPNNPTGNLFDRNAIDAIIARAPGMVVLDEAYHAFAGDSFVGDVVRYNNLVVLRTLSKMGLAGLRVGVALGKPAWLHELNKLRLPYNINVLSQLSAEFALGHQTMLDTQTAHICRDREQLIEQLRALSSVTPYPSQANFVLFRVASGRADEIFAGLKARRVLIKNLHGSHPQLADCLRVTVGTPDENQAFLEALKAVLAGK